MTYLGVWFHVDHVAQILKDVPRQDKDLFLLSLVINAVLFDLQNLFVDLNERLEHLKSGKK